MKTNPKASTSASMARRATRSSALPGLLLQVGVSECEPQQTPRAKSINEVAGREIECDNSYAIQRMPALGRDHPDRGRGGHPLALRARTTRNRVVRVTRNNSTPLAAILIIVSCLGLCWGSTRLAQTSPLASRKSPELTPPLPPPHPPALHRPASAHLSP
jgi:hypothetical protein